MKCSIRVISLVYYHLMMSPEKVEEMLKVVFPEAKIQVRDQTGTGDHFEIWVASKDFAGKTLIQQHQMVHQALEKEMDRGIHAVQIRTRAVETK